MRYAEALGAERFVDTNNVCGVPGSANPFLQNYYKDKGTSEYDAIFSYFDLDSDELIEAPQALVSTCCLQGGADPDNWETLGTKPQVFNIYKDREQFAADHGVKILKTCTPYIVGNTPAKGEHCAWMESSAVVYCNSVLGARTNTEGRESTSAAMLTGKIPDWGFHRDEFRYGSHRIDVEIPIESVMDWGMLGYFVGDVVQERIPVLTGKYGQPDLDSPQTFRRRRCVVRRRRAVSHRRRHAGSADARGGIRAEHAGRDIHVRRGRAEADVRGDQLERERSERRLRDARLSACGARANRRGLPPARRTPHQREQRAVDLHVARGEGASARRAGSPTSSRRPAASS